MATARKTLGRAAPSATTDTTLYTVPTSTDTVVSSIVMCETNGAAATVRVCTDSGGATSTSAGHAIAWNLPLAANETVVLQLGITLEAGATIVAQASTAHVTFSVFGQENT